LARESRVLSECHRDESEDEIKVTPEMIEAGYNKLMDLPELLYGCSTERFKSTLGQAFLEMLKASPAARPKDRAR
jgi:hypothetical protein